MKKILIVEDDAELCLLLNILLEGDGVQLDHVKSITAAVSYLHSEKPDVVILDNKLPDGLGIDFIPGLKKTFPDVKVIMISGFTKAASDVALYNGADVFLTKPFSKDQLHQAVNGLLHAKA